MITLNDRTYSSPLTFSSNFIQSNSIPPSPSLSFCLFHSIPHHFFLPSFHIRIFSSFLSFLCTLSCVLFHTLNIFGTLLSFYWGCVQVLSLWKSNFIFPALMYSILVLQHFKNNKKLKKILWILPFCEVPRIRRK